MWLTCEEYQDFKIRFHCTAWPDEDNRVPVDVEETPEGIPPWTAYISGSRLREAVDWIKWRRSHSTASSAAEREARAIEPNQEARTTTWPRPDLPLVGPGQKPPPEALFFRATAPFRRNGVMEWWSNGVLE